MYFKANSNLYWNYKLLFWSSVSYTSTVFFKANAFSEEDRSSEGREH